MHDANIASLLARRAAMHPSRNAIVDSAQRITFGELAARVARVAAGLRASGAVPGDRVLIFVPMSVELYVTLLGTLHAGAVAVFVDAWANRRRLDAAIDKANPAAFIGTRRAQFLRLLSSRVRRIPRAFMPSSRAFSSTPPIDVHAVPVDWPALVTFTTGSTGAPKAAERSHGFLVAQHEALAAHLEPRADDVDMPTLPVFVLNNLASGVTSVIPDADPRRPADIDPTRVLRQMHENQVTTSSGSPAFYEKLAEHCKHSNTRIPLRSLFTGGAPVLPPLARQLRDYTVGTANVVYGSTEAEPIAGITANELIQLSAGGDGVCVGKPVEQIAVKLIHPADHPVTLGDRGWPAWEVAPGDVGEIVVAGAHVLETYLHDPDAVRENKISDGETTWHRTGDGARLDAAGRLWLMGRVRQRVVRDGVTWWPLGAEVRALTVPGVSHAAYVGVANGAHGNRAMLCVEADPRESERVRRESVAAVAPWPVDDVRVLPKIPRDPRHASKTDVETLRKLIAR